MSLLCSTTEQMLGEELSGVLAFYTELNFTLMVIGSGVRDCKCQGDGHNIKNDGEKKRAS